MTETKVSIFDQDLPQTPANHAPISPLSFIERTAEVYPTRLAIVHGDLRQDWATTYRRTRQLASALAQAGIGKNDTVAVMLPNGIDAVGIAAPSIPAEEVWHLVDYVKSLPYEFNEAATSQGKRPLRFSTDTIHFC